MKKWYSVLALLFLATGLSAQQDRHLDEWYAGFNHSYFQDELPANTVITRNLVDDRFMAITEYENGRYHIALNPKFNLSRKTEKINLLHESCHILIFIEHEEEFDDHGPKWQHCMHNLADQGAFEDLW